MRRDQQPANSNFRGSGLPIPLKGSCTTAATSSSTRNAAFRSVLTQYIRSPRNSARKTASRSARLIKPNLLKSNFPPQLLERHPPSLASTGIAQGFHQALGVSGRAEQVCSLHQTRQFVGRYQRN